MKEVLMYTRSEGGTVVYGLSGNAFVGRKVPDYYEANQLSYAQTDKEPARKMSTHQGSSEPSGGSGVLMEGWALLSVEDEFWDRCVDEFSVSPEFADRVAGIVRRIRRQMKQAA